MTRSPSKKLVSRTLDIITVQQAVTWGIPTLAAIRRSDFCSNRIRQCEINFTLPPLTLHLYPRLVNVTWFQNQSIKITSIF